MSRVRLSSLELESFRGFAEVREVDLAADVVLVRGDNGSGKTSLIDGLLWLFTGELPRLTERARGLRRGPDAVVNRYTGGEARVRLRLDVDQRRLEFERRGTADESELVVAMLDPGSPPAEGALAKAFGSFTPTELTHALRTWGVLQQHAMSAALDSGAAMHERLSQVVGLERVTRFAAAATATAKSLGRERNRLRGVHNDLSRRATTTRERLLEAQSQLLNEAPREHKLAEDAANLLSALPEGIVFATTPSQLDELTGLGRHLTELIDAAQRVADQHAELQNAAGSIDKSVEDIEAELAVLRRQAVEALERAPKRVQLASAALHLLSERCPVCGQEIDEATVRAHLLEELSSSQLEAESAATAQASVSRAEARVAKAKEARVRRESAMTSLDAAVKAMRDEIGKVPSLDLQQDWLHPGRAQVLVRELAALRDGLRKLFTEAARDPKGYVERLSAEADALASEVHRARTDLDDIEARCARAATLDKAAHKAAERIVERALRNLEPSFAEVFDRLAPHPTFTQLRAKQDIYYGRNQIVPEVYDPERRLTANPLLVFSEGQLNVVALSYFLGLALNAREGALPFLVLDDPLQAIDVLGVLGFADLCRRIREHRQLVVTTHDRRFAAVLARKLGPREAGTRLLVHEFDGWTREGPRIRTSEEPLAEVLPLVRRRAS